MLGTIKMSTAEKLGMAIIGVAMVTTLILPRRQTVPVITAAFNGARGFLATAMGTGKRV
ncbi:MAG: hypothetical protein L0Y54_17090 [Sporichthyaceae bacterium]|nr:hypothetical protein [Sporichthyaceae bacterium]